MIFKQSHLIDLAIVNALYKILYLGFFFLVRYWIEMKLKGIIRKRKTIVKRKIEKKLGDRNEKCWKVENERELSIKLRKQKKKESKQKCFFF